MSLLGSESRAQRNNLRNSEVFATHRKMCYYYVVIPPEDQAVSKDTSTAVSSVQDLSAIMKRNPHARFQSASSAEEAMKKALEKIQFSKDTESIPSPKPERRRGRSSLSLVEGSLGAPATPSPKTDELLMLGREIITKQNEKVLDRIEKNPRILCTESEFPTILQEGCKLNAMHLAAKSGNHVILKHILNYASSMDFMRRIYPNQSEERLKSCSKHLCSCYLNTPDKMLQDTPLHFACKFNAVECVEFLLSHPFCDTFLKNYDKQTPFEVIGQRDSQNSAKATAIRNLFKRRFIIPIWRDESVDGDPPVLGDVSFIPDLGQAIPPPLLSAKFPDFSLSLLEPCKPKLLPKTSQSNKLFASHPPSWKVMAFAGPVDEKSAKEFRQVMKRSRLFLAHSICATPESSFNVSGSEFNEFNSPPSTPKRKTSPSQCTPPASSQLLLSPINSPQQIRALCESPARNCSPLKTDMATRVRDIEKGLERIAFEYAHEMNIPWSEYWKFLGTYCDLTTDEGLELLENYLRSVEERKKEEIEKSKESDSSPMNNTLDDVIDKLTNMRLSNSGVASPDGKTGFCTNPKCKLESRFCNCDEVVPAIPYHGEIEMMESWMYGDTTTHPDRLPFSSTAHQFMGIRKLDSSANTDSFEPSNENNSGENDFNWPIPDYIDVFETAPSSPAELDQYEDCDEGVSVYFNGSAPGKLDFQVYQILKDCHDNLDRNKHLVTFQWLNAMIALGNALAQNHRRTRTHDTSVGTPQRPWGPSFASTPVRGRKTALDDSF